MGNTSPDSLNRKTIVSLFSDPNFLSVNILENLLSKNCFVNIITDDTRSWHKKTDHLTNRSRFVILKTDSANTGVITYSIIVSGFIKGSPYENINQLFRNYNFRQSKNLIVLPLEKYSFSEDTHLKVEDNTGIIYIGDLFGPRMDLESDLLAPHLISGVLFNRKINIGVGELIYPIFVSDAAKTITKWLFSFGPFGKETILLGPQVSGTSFWKDNRGVVGEVSLHYDERLQQRMVPRGLEIKQLQCNLRFSLIETYRWFSKISFEKKQKSLKGKLFIENRILNRKYPKFFKPLIISAGTVLLAPFLFILLSATLFLISYKQFVAGQDQAAVNSILAAKTLSVVSKNESLGLSFIPVLGKVYKETTFISGVGERLANIGVVGTPVIREASNLADKIFGNQIYDPGVFSNKLSEGLDSLYREISLLQADTKEGAVKNIWSAKTLQNSVNLEKIMNLALQGRQLSGDLGVLTGAESSKTYLLLFQNNMELRPTGGFIGSFGILTFDGGRITDLTVNDVYSADGQLNGHVEPPEPIKKYLGEANWWLRDSNWDPDFTTSAKRAEWFLDKEVGRQVDGVLAIDLQPIKDILKYTGPIFLSDFNLDISNENIYQKTQEEVESNFFPGTHKKASFLTALSRNLLSQISKLNTGQKAGIAKAFYYDLEGRHIQAYIHDDNSQMAITNLGWDGGVNVSECGVGCYSDSVGIVEANVGVNKVNYFIKRTQKLDVKILGSKIERKLTVNLENTANPQLGLSGKYKVYIRLLTPSDVHIISVKTITGEIPLDLQPEISDLKGRKETGVLVEILGSQSKRVEFKWENDIQDIQPLDKYGIYVRKQAGVSDDPFTLTINGKNVYNRPLASDYFNRFPL